MNKGEIRTRILEQVDWNPSQSTDFKAKADRLINRAYQALCLEAPFLFFEDEAKIITQKDVGSITSNTDDVLAINPSDSYVLERYYLSSSSTKPQSWAEGSGWGSRMIELTKSDGTVIRRRVREFWSEQNQNLALSDASYPAGTYDIDRVTVDVPWPNNTDSGMTYRIYTEAYELPADVVELRSARLWSNTHYPLEVSSQAEMERHEYIDFQGNEIGRPYRIFRGRHMQIDAPTKAPRAQIKSDRTVQWEGPQPQGTFDFCYTYIWGKRSEGVSSPGGFREPRWESAPSPVSEKVTAFGVNQTVTLTTVNIDHQLNFFREFNSSGGTISSPTRTKRSGLRKRIYIRRYSQEDSSKALVVNDIETPEIFFLLAEINGHNTTYTVDGTTIPDYYRRLKEVHGYQSIRFWPMPDDEYEVDCRVLRRPQPLVHDHDAPRIHEEAVDALIQKALVLFYEMSGQYDVSNLADNRYRDILLTLTKRYGQISAARPRKRMSRVRPGVRETRVVYKP
jgi:hypothetical protein